MTTYTISAGHTSGGITLNNNDVLNDYGVANAPIDNGGTINVYRGGVINGSILNSGGKEWVAFFDLGGTTNNTTINNGGVEYLGADSVSNNTTVNSGGTQEEYGTAYGTIINSGGQEFILYGGLANNSTVAFGGFQEVYAGSVASGTNVYGGQYTMGKTINTKIYSGGFDNINSGGVASNTTVNSGGNLLIDSGSLVSGGIVASGGKVSGLILENGSVVVSNGAYVIDGLNIQSGALVSLEVASGASITDFIENQATLTIDYGAIVSGSILNGGIERVHSGGKEIGASVLSGGIQYVGGEYDTFISSFKGGFANGTTVNSGGEQWVLNGGVANVTTVNGGRVNVDAGGSVSNITVNSGGSLTVSEFYQDGGVVSNVTVNNGGEMDVLLYGVASNITVNSGGLVVREAGVISGGTVESGGTLFGALFLNSAAISINGTLVIDNISIHSGAIVQIEVASGASVTGFDSTGTEGKLTVDYRAVASGTTVQNGGSEVIYGTAWGTTVNSGGHELVYGWASGTIVNNGGFVSVQSGGIINNISVSVGAVFDFSDIIATSAVVNTTNQLVLSTGGNVVDTINLNGNNSNFIFTTSSDGNGGTNIKVSLSPPATHINSASYNTATGVLHISGTNFTTSIGDYNVNDLTLTGNGGVNYTLTGSSVYGTPTSTGVNIQLSQADQLAVKNLLNNYGNQSTDGNTYNLSVSSGWDKGAIANNTVCVVVTNLTVPEIVGSWYGQIPGQSGSTEVLTLLNNGHFYVANDGNSFSSLSGVEYGSYTWNSTTGAFSAIDTGNTSSLAGLSAITHLSVNGNSLELSNGQTLVNVPEVSNSILGSWYVTNAGPNVSVEYTLLANGELYATDVNNTNGNIGVSVASYTWDATNSELTIGNVQLSTIGSTLLVSGAIVPFSINGNQASLIAGNGDLEELLRVSPTSTSITLPTPTLSAVTYNAITGVFTFTGNHLDNYGSNVIALGDLALTGDNSSFTFNSSDTISNLTAYGFTVSLSSLDQESVNAFVNANGTSPLSGAAYNLTASSGWDSGSGAAITTQAVSVSGVAATDISGILKTVGVIAPAAVSVDSSGDVFLVNSSTNSMQEVVAGSNTVISLPGTFKYPVTSITVDHSGDVFVFDSYSNSIKEISATTQTLSTITNKLYAPMGVGMVTDNQGDVFIAVGNAVKEILAGTSTPITLATGFNMPKSIAIDSNGDLFVSDTGNNAIKEIQAVSHKVTTLVSGLHAPNGIAVDYAGNVFFADTKSGAIDEYAANTKLVSTLASGLVSPTNLVLDNAGNIFATQSNNNIAEIIHTNYDLSFGNPTSISSLIENTAQIELSQSVFTALAGESSLAAANFSNAATATSPLDYLYYDANTGGLFYEAGGSTGSAAVEIAVVGTSSHPAELSVGDFKLVV